MNSDARDLIFHTSIPCDRTFPWVPFFFTLLPWPCFTYHLKTLTLLITFEQWELERWHLSEGTKVFTLWHWTWSLTYVLNTCTLSFFFQVNAGVFILHMNIYFDKIFLLELNLLTLIFDSFFKKINIIHHKIINMRDFALHTSIS